MSSAEEQASAEAVETIRRWLALQLGKLEVMSVRAQPKVYDGLELCVNPDVQIALALAQVYQGALRAASLQRGEPYRLS